MKLELPRQETRSGRSGVLTRFGGRPQSGITVIFGMRFSFDARKSQRLRANPRRGIGFEEAQRLFSQPYWLDQRSDAPEQVSGYRLGRRAAVFRDLRGSRGSGGRDSPPRHSVEVDKRGDSPV